jgi:DNA-binding NarL/FixJ family response regulator
MSPYWTSIWARSAPSISWFAAKGKGFQGRILVVTAGVSDQEAVQLVEAGVAGILHKKNPTEVLCDTVRQVARGEVCLEKDYLAPYFDPSAVLMRRAVRN